MMSKWSQTYVEYIVSKILQNKSTAAAFTCVGSHINLPDDVLHNSTTKVYWYKTINNQYLLFYVSYTIYTIFNLKYKWLSPLHLPIRVWEPHDVNDGIDMLVKAICLAEQKTHAKYGVVGS